VEVRGDLDAAVELLRKPIIIDDHTVCAVSADAVDTKGNGGILKIIIVEGRNRQIRKMCEACGLSVRSLKRISIGLLELGDLKTGHWRYLRNDEVNMVGP
jgi:pseudouridine synthase